VLPFIFPVVDKESGEVTAISISAKKGEDPGNARRDQRLGLEVARRRATVVTGQVDHLKWSVDPECSFGEQSHHLAACLAAAAADLKKDKLPHHIRSCIWATGSLNVDGTLRQDMQLQTKISAFAGDPNARLFVVPLGPERHTTHSMETLSVDEFVANAGNRAFWKAHAKVILGVGQHEVDDVVCALLSVEKPQRARRSTGKHEIEAVVRAMLDDELPRRPNGEPAARESSALDAERRSLSPWTAFIVIVVVSGVLLTLFLLLAIWPSSDGSIRSDHSFARSDRIPPPPDLTVLHVPDSSADHLIVGRPIRNCWTEEKQQVSDSLKQVLETLAVDKDGTGTCPIGSILPVSLNRERCPQLLAEISIRAANPLKCCSRSGTCGFFLLHQRSDGFLVLYRGDGSFTLGHERHAGWLDFTSTWAAGLNATTTLVRYNGLRYVAIDTMATFQK